jgi:hypothetical protein
VRADKTMIGAGYQRRSSVITAVPSVSGRARSRVVQDHLLVITFRHASESSYAVRDVPVFLRAASGAEVRTSTESGRRLLYRRQDGRRSIAATMIAAKITASTKPSSSELR